MLLCGFCSGPLACLIGSGDCRVLSHKGLICANYRPECQRAQQSMSELSFIRVEPKQTRVFSLISFTSTFALDKHHIFSLENLIQLDFYLKYWLKHSLAICFELFWAINVAFFKSHIGKIFMFFIKHALLKNALEHNNKRPWSEWVILDSEIDMFTAINQFNGKTLATLEHKRLSRFNRTREAYNCSQLTIYKSI